MRCTSPAVSWASRGSNQVGSQLASCQREPYRIYGCGFSIVARGVVVFLVALLFARESQHKTCLIKK